MGAYITLSEITKSEKRHLDLEYVYPYGMKKAKILPYFPMICCERNRISGRISEPTTRDSFPIPTTD